MPNKFHISISHKMSHNIDSPKKPHKHKTPCMLRAIMVNHYAREKAERIATVNGVWIYKTNFNHIYTYFIISGFLPLRTRVVISRRCSRPSRVKGHRAYSSNRSNRAGPLGIFSCLSFRFVNRFAHNSSGLS